MTQALSGQRTKVETTRSPRPTGSYSQGIVWADLLWISGQTPRLPNGELPRGRSLGEQVTQVLTNADQLARTVGSTLADALKITVYLRDPTQMQEFNLAYSNYFSASRQPVLPARTTVQSALPVGDIEIDAVIPVNQSNSNR